MIPHDIPDLTGMIESLETIERTLYHCERTADKAIESATITGPEDTHYFRDINHIIDARSNLIGAIYKLKQAGKR